MHRDDVGRDVVQAHGAQMLAPIRKHDCRRISEPGQAFVEQMPEKVMPREDASVPPLAAASVRAAQSSAASFVRKDRPVAG